METHEKLDLQVKYDMYWNILRQNHEMIRFSELKAGFIISIFGIVFSLLFTSIEQLKDILVQQPIILAMAIIFILTTMASFGYSFLCFIPRFENKNPTSIIYFGDIISDFDHYSGYHKFVEDIINRDEDFTLQLAEQIHTNAAIATKKFGAVSRSIRLLLWSLLMLLVILITMMIMQ